MPSDDTQIITKLDPKVQESYWLSHNLSGRFWIAFSLVVGLVISTALVLSGITKLDTNAAIAVYTSFSSGSIGLIGIYMGQNSKPKDQQATTTAVK